MRTFVYFSYWMTGLILSFIYIILSFIYIKLFYSIQFNESKINLEIHVKDEQDKVLNQYYTKTQ